MSSPKLQTGRISDIGAWYAVTIISHQRQPWFEHPELAGIVTGRIAQCEREGAVASVAWVMMPDHLHWLLQLRAPTLSRCLQAFKPRTARAVNAARGSTGPVWQAGFYDHRMRDDEDLRTQARYIIGNPLRRGLVPRIEDYPFWWCRWIECQSDL